jgi:hypothetical protein
MAIKNEGDGARQAAAEAARQRAAEQARAAAERAKAEAAKAAAAAATARSKSASVKFKADEMSSGRGGALRRNAVSRLGAAGLPSATTATTATAPAALPGNGNGPLASRNQNQFVPDDVLKSGDPAKVRQFITDSNTAAYKDDLDQANAKIDEVQKKIDAVKAEPTDVVNRMLVNTLTAEKAQLVEDRDKLITERDTQTSNAIGEFDKQLAASTAAGSKNPVGDAGAKYNEYVFFHSSEGEKVPDPSTLYATGKGDGWKIEPNDITQGNSLGDCYLLAGMASIAKDHPEQIEKMIKDNGDGTYTVTFHREVPDDSVLGRLLNRTKDEAFQITVDLTVPSNGAHAKPGDIDGKSGATEVWPLVIEKAYAQLKQSYGAMDGGSPADALYTLTGSKAPRTDMGTVSAESVEQYAKDGRPMVVDTCGADDKALATYGLVGSHAYSVKGIKTDADGKKYVLLYNPWGEGNEPKPIPIEEAAKLIPNFYVS